MAQAGQVLALQQYLAQMLVAIPRLKVPPQATPLEGEVEVAQPMPLGLMLNTAEAVGAETKSTHLQAMLAEVLYLPQVAAAGEVHL